jgi:hypothetical protein
MRADQLIDLLRDLDPQTEVRIASALEDVVPGASVHDLPILGLSSDFGVPQSVRLKTPAGSPTAWIVTSYLIAPKESSTRRGSRSPL